MDYTRVIRYSNIIKSYLGIQNQGDLLLQSLRNFLQMLNQCPQIFKIIHSPIISVVQKCNLVDKIIAQNSPQYVKNILMYLIRRESNLLLLNPIVLRLEDLLYQNSKVKVKITTALAIGSHEKTLIEKFLRTKLNLIPVCNFAIDKKLLKGFIIEYSNKFLDFSILGILNKMKKNVINKFFD